MIIRIRNRDKIAIHNSYEAHRVMQHIITRDKDINLTKEHFWTIALDIKKIIVNIELLGIGTSYRVLVPLKDIFYIPYQKQAATLILIHNHPSGRLGASQADLDLTDNVMRIGEIMGIQVIDHLILGGHRGKTNHYYSFKDQHIMEGLQLSTKYLLKPEAEALLMEHITQLHNIIDLQKENNNLIFKQGEKIGIKIGEEQGKIKGKLEIVKVMLDQGFSIENIMRYTGLSESDIQQVH
ncbi:MAG: JAB domain-containing protein [Candidatus Cardinium sp.]|nr:JAB domain-containing protein [Candidatus Cardinium sp.]